MAQALRVISVQRGIDPRPYMLVSFGGAGGLHVCALADALGMRRALVPIHAGVLSALGMLAAPRSRQLSRTLTGVLADFSEDELTQKLQILAAGGTQELIAEGVAVADIETDFSLDLRYQGQSYTLNLPWQGLTATSSVFHTAHEQRYGHRLDVTVELVNLRCGLRASPPQMQLPLLADGVVESREPSLASLAGVGDPVPVWARSALCAGQVFAGPALVTETVATTWLPAGWCCRVDQLGNLLLQRDDIQAPSPARSAA
jgi:N-methylhydantoinase A